MQNLEQPVKRHTSGKLPSHSEHNNLHTHWKQLDAMALRWVLQKHEYVDEDGKPTRTAVADGLIDRCGRTALWNLEAVHTVLTDAGMTVERAYVNQELPANNTATPTWANLGTIGTFFGVSARMVGKWLNDIGVRDEDGSPSKDSFDNMLVNTVQMNAGGKKTRDVHQWDMHRVLKLLVDAGHPLDDDYGKTLEGRGKNSDVTVETIDDRAKEFARNFVKLYKDPATRPEANAMVRKTPRGILQKAEKFMKRPGFFTKNTYLKY